MGLEAFISTSDRLARSTAANSVRTALGAHFLSSGSDIGVAENRRPQKIYRSSRIHDNISFLANGRKQGKSCSRNRDIPILLIFIAHPRRQKN